MHISDIRNEDDLRAWLRANGKHIGDVAFQFVEPSPLLGSAIGAADIIMKLGDVKVDIELKYLHLKQRGIKFTLRPSQRRFHHSSMRHGGKTALLFALHLPKTMFIIRGDHIPLRDYAIDPDSGCNGQLDLWPIGGDDKVAITELRNIIFNSNFWC
jgi:hypothetical protein